MKRIRIARRRLRKQATRAHRRGRPRGWIRSKRGERVLNGVVNNDLFIVTHPEYMPGVKERLDAILASEPEGRHSAAGSAREGFGSGCCTRASIRARSSIARRSASPIAASRPTDSDVAPTCQEPQHRQARQTMSSDSSCADFARWRHAGLGAAFAGVSRQPSLHSVQPASALHSRGFRAPSLRRTRPVRGLLAHGPGLPHSERISRARRPTSPLRPTASASASRARARTQA